LGSIPNPAEKKGEKAFLKKKAKVVFFKVAGSNQSKIRRRFDPRQTRRTEKKNVFGEVLGSIPNTSLTTSRSSVRSPPDPSNREKIVFGEVLGSIPKHAEKEKRRS